MTSIFTDTSMPPANCPVDSVSSNQTNIDSTQCKQDAHSKCLVIQPTDQHVQSKCDALSNQDKLGKSLMFGKSERLPTLDDYLRCTELLFDRWHDAPLVNLSINHFSYTVKVAPDEMCIPSVGKSFLDAARKLTFQSAKPVPFEVLRDVTCTINNRSMTLILGPPGSSKSTLLKALAGRLDVKQSRKQSTQGDVLFNGLTRDEHQSINQSVSKLCAYIGQTDVHMANLTVRETLDFSFRANVADLDLLNLSNSQPNNQNDQSINQPSAQNNQSNNQSMNQHICDAELKLLHDRKVDLILSVLGMHECSETIVGNESLRGISGGQKRRLSVAEFMITNARALLLDEVTSGLDAAVSRDLFDCLKRWCQISGATVVTALNQVTPEVYALFNEIILLREGSIVYQGPKEDIAPFLWTYHGIEVNPGQDIADFLVEWLTDPSLIHSRQQRRWLKHGTPHAVAGYNVPRSNGNNVDQDLTVVKPETARVCVITDSMIEAYKSSPWFDAQDKANQQVLNERENGTLFAHSKLAVQNASPYSQAQFMQQYAHSSAKLTKLVVGRQFVLTSREYLTIPVRLVSSTLVSVISGSLFFQLAPTAYYAKFGMLLSAVLNLAMGNFTELVGTFEGRSVVIKHLDAEMYPASSFISSVVIMWMPVMIAESILFAVPIYFMSGLIPDAGRFFFFTLVLFLTDFMYAALFRAACYTVGSVERGEQIVNPLYDCLILFGGFMVTADKIPDFLIEFYYLSPVSWAFRSLAQNEFLSPSYQGTGNEALALFEIQTNKAWKFAGVGYLIGFILCCLFSCSFFLSTFRFDVSQGTKRQRAKNLDEMSTLANPISIGNEAEMTAPQIVRNPSSGQRNVALSLPFTPASLVFKDLQYTVTVKAQGGGGTVDRKLLNGINGYVKPGQLVALIGSSGAGKSTLMDVIAGRKTIGKIEGTILVNGQPQDPQVYSRVSGYCEQNDPLIHNFLSTVRESFLFSAFCRLPKSVDAKTREAFVDEVIDLLELTSMKDRIIGSEHYAGLSPAQLKLVTIGVELCSNPSILFLDEPTSSLDSRAALMVMRVVKNIALTGRTVLCTIHQPSSEVFYLFDRLLLLKSGGQTVYWGPVGDEGASIVEYFEHDSRTGEEARNYEGRHDAPKIPFGMNPATWILNVIGAGVDGALLRAQVNAGHAVDVETIDYAVMYQASELCKIEMAELEVLKVVDSSHEVKVVLSDYEKPVHKVFLVLFKRSILSAWRDSHTNFGRILAMVFIGFVFGLIFLQLDTSDYAGVNSKLNAIFYITILAGISQTFLSVPAIVHQKPLYVREQASKSYPAWCYSLCMSLVDVPFIAAATMAIVLPSYLLIGFNYDANDFFRFYVATLLGVLSLCAFGQWTAATFNSYVISMSVLSTMLLFFFLFGGSFLHPSEIPDYWLWFFYLSPIPRVLFACSVDQFRCKADHPYTNIAKCPSIDLLADGGTTERVTTHAYVNSILKVGYDSYGNHLGYLIAMWIFWQLATASSIRYVNHVKR